MAEPQIKRLPHWPTVGSTRRPRVRDRNRTNWRQSHWDVAPINSAEDWRASAHYDQRGANSKILASAVSVRSAIALPRLAASNGRCRRYGFCRRLEVVGE